MKYLKLYLHAMRIRYWDALQDLLGGAFAIAAALAVIIGSLVRICLFPLTVLFVLRDSQLSCVNWVKVRWPWQREKPNTP